MASLLGISESGYRRVPKTSVCPGCPSLWEESPNRKKSGRKSAHCHRGLSHEFRVSCILRGYRRLPPNAEILSDDGVPDMKLLMTLLLVALSAEGQHASVSPVVEDIYIARSLRTSRVMPTDF